MSDQKLMKDGLGVVAVARIGANLRRAWRPFPKSKFSLVASDGLEELELKQRVRHVILALKDCLPSEFELAVDVLVAAGRKWDEGDPNDNLNGFAAWPLLDFIGEYGLEHPKRSLEALHELTSLFSAEFAIRPLLMQHQELTLSILGVWTADANFHVRRLVSEGTRPRLPWGKQLPKFIEDPSPVLELLEKLRNDDSEYVRRSVANNLNDISKDHPKVVIKTCRRWQKNANAKRTAVIRHATRTLVKANDPGIWKLLGYADPPMVQIRNFKLTIPNVQLGESLAFEFSIVSRSNQPQRLVVDYAIHHLKANGNTTPKVFKLKIMNLQPDTSSHVTKRHSFRLITTRRYYVGKHSVEILVNGQTLAREDFQLTGDGLAKRK